MEKFLYWQDQITRAEKAVPAPRQTAKELFVPVQVSRKSFRTEHLTVEDVTGTPSMQIIEIVVAGGRFILRLSDNFHSGRLYQIIAMLEGFEKC